MSKQPQSPSPAPAVKTEPKGKRTVTVACKFPSGLVLQLCEERSYVEETQAGGRITRRRFDKVGPAVVIRGPAEPQGQAPKGYKRPETSGGYALTHGVDADFFEEWMAQNKDFPLVVNKMIFASSSRDHASGEAEDLAHTRSGYEPLTPDNDDRVAKPIGAGVTPIETEEGRRAS